MAFVIIDKQALDFDIGIDSEGAGALAEALKVNQTLQKIYLKHSEIDNISQMATVLKDNKYIKEVDLSENRLALKGAREMAEVLKVNRTLTTLDFGGNSIDDAGACLFAEGLKFNNTLETLIINQKYNSTVSVISDTGVQAFNTMLQEYNVSLCKLEYRSPHFGVRGYFPVGKEVDICTQLVKRNELLAELNNVVMFRNRLNELQSNIILKI